ncbi:glutaminase [Endozoicomonas euniceicola]|uniref:Glutaminase n=1 Tax=Endozoicomonas euniceicola TaxID=1234143 RepID=A0ABY6GYR8_9GAMM|nr:glutaminase [Endozoicomonas euniceicola]UYM17820.1 glutaminase [Endozoicomonas euniceicola]
MENIQNVLASLPEVVADAFGQGKPAGYIPALSQVDPGKFGMAISTVNGDDFVIGDADEFFSIQSISKVFNLSLAMHYAGEDLFKRVGVEPSGTTFNSLSQLEYENGIPRNPFINAGALVVTDALLEFVKSPKRDFLDFVRGLSNNIDVHYDEEVFRSEYDNGQRNAALANYLKSFGNLDNHISRVLDFYFYQCSVSMSCRDLARAFRFLAQDGRHPYKDEQVVSRLQARRINSLMMTCGTYDEAGEFAFKVGLPCKSGVGGGIVAVIPGEMSVCVWSPELGPKGNSIVGMEALKYFARKAGRSIF